MIFLSVPYVTCKQPIMKRKPDLPLYIWAPALKFFPA